MVLVRVKESSSGSEVSSVIIGLLEIFSTNHLSEPRKPQRSRKRWPKPTQSFSTRAMKPSMVRKYGSRQICARLLSWDVRSQPSEQWMRTWECSTAIWRTTMEVPSRRRPMCSSQPERASNSRLGGRGVMSESLMASMTFWRESRITWMLSIPRYIFVHGGDEQWR